MTIQVDNSYPSVQITSPAAGTTWAVGDTITFSGSATDAQDGNLSNTLDWDLILYHCAGAICHKHPITGWDNVAGASFVAPDHEYPSFLQLDVTATDSSGASSTASLRLDPQTIDLLFESAPSGLELVVGNQAPEATPFTRTVIRKSVNSLSAISPQTLSGSTYSFSQWSDGLAQTHQVTANQAATYRATYEIPPVTPCTSELPAVTDATWQRNGSAIVSGSAVQLTAAVNSQTGSVVYTQAMASAGLHVCFDAQITGGSGADGMTLMLLDASAGNGALGAGGSGLGFGGLPGMAVALDTYQGTGDPSDNFVGVADTRDGRWTALPGHQHRHSYARGQRHHPSRGAGGQRTAAGHIGRDPGAGCGVRQPAEPGAARLQCRHRWPEQSAPGQQRPGRRAHHHHARPAGGQPTSVGFGSVAVGSSATANVVLSNTGGSSLSLSSVTLPTSPFSAVAPTIGAGTVIPAGGSVTQVVRFAPTATGPATGSLSVTPNTGQGPITVSLSGSGTSPPPCTSELPAVTDATWQRNGSAIVSGSAVQLTAAVNSQTGSVVYTQAMASAGLHVCFDAQITGGSGADGMTLMLLDASAGNGALGAGGSGLGFGGLPGMAVALDTYLGTGDPSDNFVGVADTGTVDGLHYLGTNTAIRMLEGSGTIPVEVRVVNGRLQVTLDGTLVLDVASGTLPSQVRLGFSAATGGLNNRHLVSNVRVDVPTTTTPGQLVVQPTSIGFGSVAVGSSATANVVLSNTGGSSLSLSSVTLPTSPFSAVAPTIGAGTVIPAGGSVTQVVRFSPSATGPATGSMTVTPNTGQGPITVSLSGSGRARPGSW